jgi:myosin-light-chain kinase
LKQIDNIKDYFKIGKILGQGQFGKVYRCTNIATHKEFAMKTVDIESLSANSKLPGMLQNELQALTVLSHPNIIDIKQLFKDKKRYYIISEILEGGELWDLFQ